LKSYSFTKEPFIGLLKNLANRDAFYDKITLIMDGELPTYDIHIPDGNEYCANGFFSHNSTIRGRRYNIVFVDEYADVPEAVINTVVSPFLNVIRRGIRNQLIIGSTARYKWSHLWKTYVLYKAKSGKINKDMLRFLTNKRFKVEPHKYAVYEYDFRDIWQQSQEEINQSYNISEEILEDQMTKMTRDEFGMENLNVFPDDTIGFFESKLVLDTATVKEENNQFVKSANECFMFIGDDVKADDKSFFCIGIDVARSEDPLAANFCCQIIKIFESKKILAKSIAMHGASYQEMVRTIRRAHVDFGLDRVVRIDMDIGGGGSTIRDLLAEEWTDPITGRTYMPILEKIPTEERFKNMIGGYRILNMQYQSDVFNNSMFHTMKADMEQGRLLLPQHIVKARDKEIELIGREIAKTKSELIMLEMKPTQAGFKFLSPRGHQKDRAVALGLANMGANSFLYSDINQEPEVSPVIGFWIS
jgi:hypothetical protein